VAHDGEGFSRPKTKDLVGLKPVDAARQYLFQSVGVDGMLMVQLPQAVGAAWYVKPRQSPCVPCSRALTSRSHAGHCVGVLVDRDRLRRALQDIVIGCIRLAAKGVHLRALNELSRLKEVII